MAVAGSRGFTGRLIAQATDALLAAGALRHAVTRIAREAEFGSPGGGRVMTADELRGMAALAAGGFAVFGIPAVAGLAALLFH